MKNGQFIVRLCPGGGWSAQWRAAPSSRSTCSSRRSTLKRKWTKWRPTATPELKKKRKKGVKPAPKAGPRRSPRRHSSTAAAVARATAQPLPASPLPSPAPAELLSATEMRLRRWDAMYARLKEWVESKGRLPRKRDAPALFNWLNNNRRRQRWPRRTPTQVAKLLALGVEPYRQAIERDLDV